MALETSSSDLFDPTETMKKKATIFFSIPEHILAKQWMGITTLDGAMAVSQNGIFHDVYCPRRRQFSQNLVQ
jgi:hypothetical protein